MAYTVDGVPVVATPLATGGTPKVSPEPYGLGVRTGGIKDHSMKSIVWGLLRLYG